MPVFCSGVLPLAEGLGFEEPRTRLHPLLSATTKVALPRVCLLGVVYSEGGCEVGTRSRTCLEVRRCGYMGMLLVYITSMLI